MDGISSSDGKLVFTDKNGKEQTLALQPGYYVLEETESPSGYKKPKLLGRFMYMKTLLLTN